jgi:hypothetical protein
MTDTPELEQLARRYLDLWQSQMAEQINDPLLAEAMAQAHALMTRGMSAFAAFAGLPMANAATRTNDPEAHDSPPIRTKAAGTPSADSGLDAACLVRRVALLEERMLRLEAALAGEGRGTEAGTGPRRRRGLQKGA